jgi:hypothetical protein
MKQDASFFNPITIKAKHDPLVQFIELLVKIDKREGVVRKLNEKVIENETGLNC